jgi:Rad52/22 family double-strand break repair protein
MTYFTEEQVKLLLNRIHPNRVLQRDGMSYVEGYDIRAELTRVFGFGRWTSEVLDQSLICETEVRTKTYTDKRTGEEKGGKPAWYVVYRSRVRLTVFAPDGTMVTFHDGSHVGESTHPVRGEAHGNALTNSETYALRRCAINLGDQFGLSLYNKGSLEPIVRWTLVRPEAGTEKADTNDIPQVSAEGSLPAPAEDGAENAGGTSDNTNAWSQQAHPDPGDVDEDAQAFADEAYQALTQPILEDIHRRAHEAGKLSAVVRNPSSGKTGKLALYLEWRRRQVKEVDDALADLEAAAQERGVTDLDGWFKTATEADLDGASASQIRAAAKTLRQRAEAA